MTGALTTALTVALHAGMALWSPRPRRSMPFNLQFAFGWWMNEYPVLGVYWLIAGTTAVLELRTDLSVWWVVTAIVLLDLAVLAWLGARMRAARPALAAALVEAFGAAAQPQFTRPVWWRVLLPFLSWRPDVRRIANQQYGPGRGRRIDLYVPRDRARATGVSNRPEPGVAGAGAPVLLYLHSGGFWMGSKALGAHPLLYRLAAKGWVVASANYRLGVDYSDQLADTHAALDWLQRRAVEHGGDPERMFVSGGSAGAHLAATAALTGADVAGVIGLYGYYGRVGAGPGPRSPKECVKADAPPFLLVHGEVDTLVRHEDVSAFAADLRAVSHSPVACAILPGTHHNFDFFHSVRFTAVMDAVQRFTELVLDRASRPSRALGGEGSARRRTDP